MRCKECYYEEGGRCHRYPPVYVSEDRDGWYSFAPPSVYDDYWCGEFAEFIGAPDRLEQLSTEDDKTITTEEKRKK